jgi:hypothetical protein
LVAPLAYNFFFRALIEKRVHPLPQTDHPAPSYVAGFFLIPFFDSPLVFETGDNFGGACEKGCV